MKTYTVKIVVTENETQEEIFSAELPEVKQSDVFAVGAATPSLLTIANFIQSALA